MTKDTGQQKFLVLNGIGGSGKSTLIRLIENIVGSENISNVSLADLQQRFAVSGLANKILNSCADLSIDALEDTSILKKLLGEDSLRAELKGKDAFSFKSYAKLIFSTNELPLIKSEKTNGFYRRLLILTMNKAPVTVNPNFYDELQTEINYLIELSVKALERLYSNGLITVAESSKEAVKRLRQDSDTVAAFIDNECDISNPDALVDRVRLYNAYENYCKELDRQPHTKINFYKSLRVKGFTESRSKSCRYFCGISIGKSDTKVDTKSDTNGFIQADNNVLPFR
jgi:P4 family phage/plasmid primase-like protien